MHFRLLFTLILSKTTTVGKRCCGTKRKRILIVFVYSCRRSKTEVFENDDVSRTNVVYEPKMKFLVHLANLTVYSQQEIGFVHHGKKILVRLGRTCAFGGAQSCVAGRMELTRDFFEYAMKTVDANRSECVFGLTKT